jgi:DNA-binding response OmpR family regulator
MTAHAMVGDRDRCFDIGMDGYLTKPITATDLFATVERVRRELEAGSPLLLMASKEERVRLRVRKNDCQTVAAASPVLG